MVVYYAFCAPNLVLMHYVLFLDGHILYNLSYIMLYMKF